MKYNLLCLLVCFATLQSIAQNSNRNIRFRSFPGDSLVLPLNEDYYLIEDSCAQMMRYAHFNFKERKFKGKFKDVSKLDTSLIISEGTYSDDGLKNGLFTAHYLNGKLRSKGSFKNDKYDGKWEIYYDNGSPELTFEVTDGAYRIIDSWKQDGTKLVDNGNEYTRSTWKMPTGKEN